MARLVYVSEMQVSRPASWYVCQLVGVTEGNRIDDGCGL